MRLLLPALWLMGAGLAPMPGHSRAMVPVEVHLPGHVLGISLPEEMVHGEWPLRITPQFDPFDASFLEAGFYVVLEADHDFKGPFWIGRYGSLTVHVMVHRRDPGFDGDIATVEGLERYIQAWSKTIKGTPSPSIVSSATLNVLPAVKRERYDFGQSGDQSPQDMQIFSFPLDGDMFVDVAFTVRGWQGGQKKVRSWKPKADAMRELIKATVVIEPARAR